MRDNSDWDSVCARLRANALYAAAFLWALLLLSVGAPQTAHAAIGYVQGAYATPGTASSMSLAFSSVQTAGDLNVVIVAWGDSTSTVASVVDSKGNTYAAAGAITASSGNESEQIFYAKNVVAASAGANTVTVTFSNSVIQAELRMAEYSGIDTVAPLDGFSGAVGTGLTQNSGSLTTTNANDLLVAGNGLASVTTAAGTGYTLRMTTGEGEILEDEIVSTAGSYSASSTQQTSGYWLIQVAGFKAAATAAPTISSFTPASGPVGTVITVTGTNLGGSTTTAWVGSAHDASLTNVSSTSVTITVPADAPVASDQLSIIAPGGQVLSGSNFTVTGAAAPTITSFTPTSGPPATVITVTGTNLSGATTTAWVGAAHDAPLTNVSSTSVKVTVPADAATGADQLAVFTSGGTAFSGSNFTVTAAATPAITSFTPTSGPVGTVITLTGTNLSGATLGWVGTAHDAMATNVNSTTVQITVPADAATGADQLGLVYSSGAVLSATNFTVTAAAAPTISSFTPASGPVGTVITVTGTNLSGSTTTAWVGSAHDASLTNVSSTSVTITVPADAPVASDQLSIIAPGGQVWSGQNFTVTAAAAPTITSFMPTSGPAGTVITVTGTNLSGATTTAWVGAAHDAPLTNVSSTSVKVTVPSDAATGADQLAVFTAGGTAFSGSNFTVTAAAAPTITSFTPASGPVGTVITVTGTNLSGATTTAWVGSAHDASLANVSSTSVTVTVPADAPVSADQLAVFTAGGTATSGSNFTVTSSSQPPTAPSGLTATALSSSQINLSWTASTDPAGVTGYLIQRCQGASCSTFAQIASVAGTVTTYSNTGLTASTSYSYRVQATDAAANLSAFSGTASTQTQSSTTPPTAPTGLTATPYSASEIILTWGASTDAAGVTNYLIERCSGTACSTFSQIGTSTSTGYGDTTVSAGIAYTYRVRATDAAALLSAYSNLSAPSSPSLRAGGINYTYDAGGRLTVVANGNDSTTTYTLDAAGNRTQTSVSSPSAFSAPTGVTVAPASATSLKVTWTAPTGGYGVLTYQIYRGGTQIGTSTTTTFSDTGLTPYTSPSYTVGATDAHGDPSPISAAGTNYTYALPSIASFNGASASSTSIQLTWSDPDTHGPGLSGYSLYRGSTLISSPGAGSTSYLDTGLGIATNYTYTLTAKDSAGDVASANTTAQTFPALNLTSFTATPASSTTMTLAWSASGATGQGALTYSLARGSTVIANPATSPVTDSGLAIGTSYSYTLTATDTVGDTVNVTTPGKTYPLPTASLSAGTATTSSVPLNWTATDTGGPGIKNIAIYNGGGVLQTQSTATSGSYVSTGLSPGTSYTYSMYSYDIANDTSVVSTVTSRTAGYNDAGTMTEGGISSGPVNILGFFQGTINYGSYTPTALTGGKTLIDFVDTDSNGTVEVSGFTSDPGAGWLLSATGRGTTKLGSAATYSYSAGTATWQWTNSPFGFQTSGTTSCIVSHL